MTCNTQMTYSLLLATSLTLDLRWNAEMPKFLVSKLKMTSDPVTDVSLVVSNLSYFGPSLKCRLPKIAKPGAVQKNLHSVPNLCHPTIKVSKPRKIVSFGFFFIVIVFFSLWKNADVDNQKSTVLTDAPAEVQPCEGWCFPVGERDWQPWQPWPQVVYIFIHEPTWTKALRANCPLLSQNRLRAVMMRAHCRQNGSMNLCKVVLLQKNFSFFKK